MEPTHEELRDRVEALEAHVRRLNECLIALSAGGDAFMVALDVDGQPRAMSRAEISRRNGANQLAAAWVDQQSTRQEQERVRRGYLNAPGLFGWKFGGFGGH